MASDGILNAWAKMDAADKAIGEARQAALFAASAVLNTKSAFAPDIAAKWQGRAEALRKMHAEIHGK